MKKFFALLFVCAGLTAMAVTPHVNTSNVKMNDGKPVKNMVMKTTPMAEQMTANVMKSSSVQQMQKGLSVQKFFKEKNVTPNDNLLMKKAPRRVTEDALLNADPLFFGVTYGYDSEGDSFALTLPVYQGGWNVDVENGENENEYNYYIYFQQIPNIINVDLANNTAEMLAGAVWGGQWSDTVVSAKTTTIYDTTEYMIVVNEDFLLSDDAQLANIAGKVYNDGSIYFEDGWAFFDLAYTVKRVTRNNQTTTTYDTIAELYTPLYRDTWLMTPNGNHSYTMTSNGQTKSYDNDVYMYQYDDTTAIVWNLWGFGFIGNEMYIHDDGNMMFPFQPCVYEDISAEGFDGYSYVGYNWAYDGTYLTDEGNAGTCNPDEIAWSYSKIGWPAEEGTGVVAYPAFENNKLIFKDQDNYFWIFGVTATPVITYQVTDDAVLVNLEVEEGAEWLMVVGEEYAEELPYSLPRLDEDYTVLVQAIAQVHGKDISEVAELEITVPALEPQGLRGDVDQDGSVSIGDISALIDFALNGYYPNVTAESADCDLDGSVTIGDISALIDFILNGVWPDEE
ncbi:MAG: dockerin type I repeat-containing protein [Muribaculaceae bacterium]|nr:dockerin type I repeat-containing protein [Muribaculaceae bacterium]